MQPAVRIENLSKLYRIGALQHAHYRTLRESLMDAATAPWRRIKEIRNHSRIAPHELNGHSRNGHSLDGQSSNGAAANHRQAAAGGQSHAGHAAAPDSIWALNDVSFDVQHGEVVGIIGRNGAGKSTLLKVLSRITEPTKGRVVLNGRVASLLEVGTGFHPELTGRENIYLNGAILGMHRHEIKRKFDAIVDFSGIETFLDTPVKRYSSGMYIRLAFAVAAHLDPEILIVDEVLAVGDAEFQKKCLGKMKDVAKSGRTVLFVSHNMNAVSSLCHHAVHLAMGVVHAIGDAEEVVARYLTETLDSRESDLNALRLPGYGDQVFFTEVELLDAEKGAIRFGEPIRISLEVHSTRDYADLSVGSSIFDIQGLCVGTLMTEQVFSIRANQKCRVTLTIENLHLAPGTYYAGLSVGRGNWKSCREDLEIVIGCPQFQVLPVASNQETVAQWNPQWGRMLFRDTQLEVH